MEEYILVTLLEMFLPRAGGMVQAVEYLLRKRKALSSNPSINPQKTNK
jgi:hypothetical protein